MPPKLHTSQDVEDLYQLFLHVVDIAQAQLDRDRERRAAIKARGP